MRSFEEIKFFTALGVVIFAFYFVQRHLFLNKNFDKTKKNRNIHFIYLKKEMFGYK